MNITKAYAIKDYLMAAVSIAMPFLLHFNAKDAKTILPIALGGGAMVYSLLTSYELGAMRLIAMPIHLLLDFLAGVLLAVSPWLFGFKNKTYLPHLILGTLEAAISLFTTTTLHRRNELMVTQAQLN